MVSASGIQQLIEGDEIGLQEALAQRRRRANSINSPPQPVAQGPQLLVGNEFRVRHLLPELGGIDFLFQRHAAVVLPE